MTDRQIGLHLGALVLVALLALGAFAILHSRHALPWLISGLASDDAGKRRQSAASLARLGAQALPAVDALLRLAQPDRELGDRTNAVGALVEISPAAAASLVPRLTQALRDGDPRTRYGTVMTLAALGPLGKAALPALAAAARDPQELVRRWAVNAIGRIGATSPEAVQAVVAALGDPSEAVRHDALLAYSYGFLPREAYTRAQAALQRMAQDRRYAAIAANVLREVDRPRPVALEIQLQTYALDAGGMGARIALQKLALLGPQAALALPRIAAQLDDRHPLHRYLAIEALVAIGPAAAPALPALRARLDDDDALVRATAAAAVAALEPVPAQARP